MKPPYFNLGASKGIIDGEKEVLGMFEVNYDCPYFCTDCYELGCAYCYLSEKAEDAMYSLLSQDELE